MERSNVPIMVIKINIMKKKLKLVMILNDAPFFITHRLPLAMEAARVGFEVHIFAPYHKSSCNIISKKNLYFHHIPLERGGKNLLNEMKLIFMIYLKIFYLRPEIVHLISMKPVLYGGIIARLLKIPCSVNAITGLGYLFVSSSFLSKIIKKIVYFLYAFSLNHKNSITIFQNKDDIELFLRKRLVNNSKTTIIRGCGTDIDIFKPNNKKTTDNIIMFPARILGDKGANEFFEAAKQLKDEGIKARFVVVGRTDPDNPTHVTNERINFLKKNNIIEYWGFSDNMSETLGKASIVCLPSYREGLPKVLIEAASMAKPIVTTDVPGCREIVIDQYNGILVPVKNSARLAEALKDLINNKEQQKVFGENGRKIVEKYFTTEIFVQNSMSVYKKVIDRM